MKKIILTLLIAISTLASTSIHATQEPTEDLNLILLSAGHITPAKIHLLQQLARQQGMQVTHKKLRSLNKETQLASLLQGYQLLLFDTVNANEAKEQFGHLAEQVAALDEPIKTLAIRWPQGDSLRRGISQSQAEELERYFTNGGKQNLSRMLSYIKGSLLGEAVTLPIRPPIIYPELGIYHPDYPGRISADPQEYLQWQASRLGANRPVIGITIHQETLASENMALYDAMIARIEQLGATALPFYYRTARNTPDYPSWLTLNGKLTIDVLINTRMIHWADSRQKEFEKLGITVLNALKHTKSINDWRESNGGIPAMLVPFYLTMAEMAGTIDPTVVSGKRKSDESTQPITEQVERITRKAVRFATLRHKPNRDKKVAILYYNYPPGEKSASASFLNIPRSVEQISSAMQQAGFSTQTLPEQAMIDAVATMQRPYYRNELPASLLESKMGGTLPISRYRQWFDQLPETVRQPIIDTWGKPETHFMVDENNGEPRFIIPMLKTGNLLLLPQPPRGEKGKREKSIYHSKSLPVNHYYLAVYLYLREQFGADALVHLGTHGSHEWLPGKERGLWAYDPGSLTADDVPVIYPYIVDDVGEALQAKRRGHAAMISHMTPPFAPSGLYREMSEVHELMHQYGEADPGLVKKRTRKQLIKKLEEMDLLADMGWQVEAAKSQFSKFMSELHDYMHDLAIENQPLGLHTWGKVAEDRLLVTTIMQILGSEFATAINRYEQREAAAPQQVGDQVQVENLPGFGLIHSTVIKGENITDDVPVELRNMLVRGRDLLRRIKGTLEMSSLLKALNGDYITPSTGGDPVRNDESLPSGRNLYGFDPSRLPTRAAWESGKTLVKGLIDDYVEKHGKYPDKMTFSLWSIEAMRHFGVLESQAMYAMGLRPVWHESGRVSGTEIIPYSELRRPRIDVVLSATGLYRDAFPGVMKLLAEGINKIAQLKEETNFVYRNSQKLQQELQAEGVDEAEAKYLSTIRIFSGATGSYGTGLNAGVLASDTWEKDDKLANLYMDRMGFAFGADESRWSEKVEKLYGKNLSGTDMAMFSRSSNLYGMLTSDDPFQYLGGISLAVRQLDGKSPEMFISNLRNPDQEKMENLNQFMSKELRTRYFHPRWIEQMQQEGYAGTLSVNDTVNNFWGWQVVDPQNIRADQWQEFFEIYVDDKYEMDMQQWFEQNNAEALAQITERMLEAVRKGYWQPDDETVKKLISVYDEMVQKHDVVTINEKFKEFINAKAQGYGLDIAVPVTPAPVAQPEPATAAQPQQQVQGQKLEKVESQPQEQDQTLIYFLLILLALVVLSGIIWQQWREEIMLKLKATLFCPQWRIKQQEQLNAMRKKVLK